MRFRLLLLATGLLLSTVSCKKDADVLYCNPHPGSIAQLLTAGKPSPTTYRIRASRDTVLTMPGLRLQLTANSFERSDGLPVQNYIQLNYQNSAGIGNMVRLGLHTQSVHGPLEVAGGWYLRVTDNGTPLHLKATAAPLVLEYQPQLANLSGTLGSARQLGVYAGLSAAAATDAPFQQWSAPSSAADAYAAAGPLRATGMCVVRLHPNLFNQSSTGWFSCGQPVDNGMPTSTVRITGAATPLSPTNSVVVLRLDDYNALLPAQPIADGRFAVTQVPEDARITAVVLTVPANGYYYFGRQSDMTTPDLPFTVPLTRYPESRLLEQLNAL